MLQRRILGQARVLGEGVLLVVRGLGSCLLFMPVELAGGAVHLDVDKDAFEGYVGHRLRTCLLLEIMCSMSEDLNAQNVLQT